MIEAAGEYPDILFPVFTNGTLLKGDYIKLFDKKRNLLPVLSIEGGQSRTDGRRGDGVYKSVTSAMERIQENHLMFGVSVTVTTENLQEVTSDTFLQELQDNGCKAVIYVEYVPVTEESRTLAPGDAERRRLAKRLAVIRDIYSDMVVIAFPGDEKAVGGLSGGRTRIFPYQFARRCRALPVFTIFG